LRRSMHGHWHVLWASVGCALVASAAVASIPLFLGDAVNEGLLGHHWARFGVYVGLIGLLGTAQALASRGRRWWNGVASREVESELRRAFHDHLLYLDLAYHSSVNRGQLLSRVTSDLFQIQAVVASAPFWVGNAALAIAVAAILLVTSLPLAGVALVALPLVAVTSSRFSRRVRMAISDLQRERGSLAGVVEETLSGIRAVKGFGAEPVMDHRLGGSADAVLREAMRVVRTRARYLPVLNTVPMIELAAVNWVGGYLVLHHQLSVGMLVAFNAYLASLTGPLQSIGAYIVMFQRAVVSGYRLGSIIDRPSAVPEPDEPATLPHGPGAIRFTGVKFAYPQAAGPASPAIAGTTLAPAAQTGQPEGQPGGEARVGRGAGDGRRPEGPAAGGGGLSVRAAGQEESGSPPAPRLVLDGFDLSISGGEVVALVGPTGSGKTTVLSLLARLYDPSEGHVYVDGVDVRRLPLATLRAAVAVVFEDSFLFDDTIAANLRVGRPGATRDELAWAAQLAQADEFIEQLPLGYDTPVGERGLALSGGQRQRLALARALLADPRVLVLDDATSSVDAPRELQVVRALAEARSGKTTVIISHRPATIAVADRVVLIDGGRVVAEGAHESLLEGCPRYREVLGLGQPAAVERAGAAL
jgi:ATP-binding cassette subfamily B protein